MALGQRRLDDCRPAPGCLVSDLDVDGAVRPLRREFVNVGYVVRHLSEKRTFANFPFRQVRKFPCRARILEQTRLRSWRVHAPCAGRRRKSVEQTSMPKYGAVARVKFTEQGCVA
jgi:hypothetical protein